MKAGVSDHTAGYDYSPQWKHRPGNGVLISSLVQLFCSVWWTEKQCWSQAIQEGRTSLLPYCSWARKTDKAAAANSSETVSHSWPEDPRRRAISRPQIIWARFKQGHSVNDLLGKSWTSRLWVTAGPCCELIWGFLLHTEASLLFLSCVWLEPLVKLREKLLQV